MMDSEVRWLDEDHESIRHRAIRCAMRLRDDERDETVREVYNRLIEVWERGGGDDSRA